jgi:hypothetical protein
MLMKSNYPLHLREKVNELAEQLWISSITRRVALWGGEVGTPRPQPDGHRALVARLDVLPFGALARLLPSRRVGGSVPREVYDSSIQVTSFAAALSLSPLDRLRAPRLLLPRSGRECSDFVLWPQAAVGGCLLFRRCQEISRHLGYG